MHSSFEQAYLAGKELTGDLSMDNGTLDDRIEGYAFRNCTISNGSFGGSNFEGCTFENTLFDGIDLGFTDFQNCVFNGLTLKKCSMKMIRMENCTGIPPTIQPS